MPDDSQAPATKQDIHLLKQDMHLLKQELKRHFDVTVETIRHDLLGANHDKIEVIKDRVTRLERHTGLVGTNR